MKKIKIAGNDWNWSRRVAFDLLCRNCVLPASFASCFFNYKIASLVCCRKIGLEVHLSWTSAKQPMCHLLYAESASQHTAGGIAPFSHDRRNESGIQISPKSPAETSRLLEEDLLL
ncbi:uncharacterized protein LOC127749925 [Frankliniella occidentalis]|uniref:Uncharacterized protein LOC127749925 n=1 Tax=Frankliniella occidentalis TaxID=133901 RepID=A0A9C6U1Y9_FRAOC|nr:uncharacterized protein LOC127749925 [Frankliniella occidentalis]